MPTTKQSLLFSFPFWASAALACVSCEYSARQAPLVAVPADFTKLLQRFRRVTPWDTLLPPPLIYRVRGFKQAPHVEYEVWLAKQPLGLQPQVVQLRDPAGRGNGYPVSYSIVYQQCLVALFAGGNFACFRVADFTRNQSLESQLNARKWQRHWLIDKQLIGLSQGRYYVFNQVAKTWQPYQQPVPFGTAPKLFEDARYLVYSDCQGEFGGNVYFFNKQTRYTHRANATCVTSVWRENGQYRVLASLNSAACAAIADPEVLPLVSVAKDDRINWQYDFLRPEKGIVPIFNLFGLELFGGLRWQGQTVYLTYWRQTTFLATIAGKRLTIIDPLFSNQLYTHEPVTVSYGPNLALTNLDFWGLGGKNEVAALLWQGQQLTKIEWGEQPRMQ